MFCCELRGEILKQEKIADKALEKNGSWKLLLKHSLKISSMPVKEYGDSLERFTLEFFKRVMKCPTVIREYPFRKKQETERGRVRENPTDLDVLAIFKDKIYAVTCQEWIPVSTVPPSPEKELEKLADNLNQAIENLKENFRYKDEEIKPVITFVALREENLSQLDKKIGDVLRQRAYILTLLDMIYMFIEEWGTQQQKQWATFGDFDWFFSRIIGWYRIDHAKLKQIIDQRLGKKKKYKVICGDDIEKADLKFLSPFSHVLSI